MTLDFGEWQKWLHPLLSPELPSKETTKNLGKNVDYLARKDQWFSFRIWKYSDISTSLARGTAHSTYMPVQQLWATVLTIFCDWSTQLQEPGWYLNTPWTNLPTRHSDAGTISRRHIWAQFWGTIDCSCAVCILWQEPPGSSATACSKSWFRMQSPATIFFLRCCISQLFGTIRIFQWHLCSYVAYLSSCVGLDKQLILLLWAMRRPRSFWCIAPTRRSNCCKNCHKIMSDSRNRCMGHMAHDAGDLR